MAEVTFPSHNAAEYIEHAQLLAMDYPNMLTAVAVRNNSGRKSEVAVQACIGKARGAFTSMSKIEKVPRGIQSEKSSKDMASSRNLVSTLKHKQVPKRWRHQEFNQDWYHQQAEDIQK